MKKDFFFNIGAGFLFVVLICGTIVLADYVFFEGQILKKTENSNLSLQEQLGAAQAANQELQLQLKGANVELDTAMQNLKILQKNASDVTTVLKKELDVEAAENESIKTAINTPEHIFLTHLEESINGAYPGVELVEGKFIFKDNVMFGSASAFLTQKAKTTLDQMAITIKELEEKISSDANWVIKVMGHTDAQKLKSKRPFSSNWILASSRAVTIVQYLISKGVNPNRIYAAGFSPQALSKKAAANEEQKPVRHAVISFDRRVGDA